MVGVGCGVGGCADIVCVVFVFEQCLCLLMMMVLHVNEYVFVCCGCFVCGVCMCGRC